MKDKSLLFLILLLALVVRLPLMNRGFFYDELFLVTHGLESFQKFLSYFTTDYSTANHLGYTVLSYLTISLFGIKEWAVRLPALAFGMGSILVFWYWAREYFGRWTAIAGSFLLALSPACVIWSASGRGYSAIIFFVLFSTALYFRLFEKPTKKNIVLLALVNTVAISFHLFFFAIVFLQFVHFSSLFVFSRIFSRTSLTKGPWSALMTASALSFLFSLAIYVPISWTYVSTQSATKGTLIPGFPLTMMSDLLALPLWPAGALALIIMLIGLAYSNQRLQGWHWYILLLFLIPLPIWLESPRFLCSRFFAFLVPFIFLGLANAASVLPRLVPKFFRLFVTLALVLFFAWTTWYWQTHTAVLVVESKDFFKEAAVFAQHISPKARFCSFGQEEDYFRFYSKHPVSQFTGFEEFKDFYQKGGDIVCFAMPAHHMSIEHWKIFVLLLKNASVKVFGQINVFYLP